MADVSSILAAGNVTGGQPAQLNPLQTMSTIQSITNAQQYNKLMQQELLNKQQDLANSQLTNQKGQSDLGISVSNRYASRAMASYAELADSGKTGKEARDSIQGQLDDELAQHPNEPIYQRIHDQLVSRLPAATDGNGNPTSNGAYRTWVFGQGMRALDAQQQFIQATPSVNLEKIGPNAVPVVTASPLSRAIGTGAPMQIQTGAGVPIGLTAAEANTVQKIPQASGADVPVTTGQIAAGTAPGLNGQPVPNEVQKTAAVNSQMNATNAVGQISSQAWNDQQQSLASVLNLSDKALAGKGTGPISDLISVASNVIPGIHPGVDSVATNTALLAKSLERQALNTGNRSDADLFAKIAANPNLGMTPDAIRHATRYVMALNLQEKVLVQEASNKATYKPLDPKTFYEQQRLAVQNGLDQNAFVHTYLPDDGSYYAGLSSSGKDRYDNTRKLIQQYATPSASLKAVQ